MRAATCFAFVAVVVSATACGAERASPGAGQTSTSTDTASSWGVSINEPPRSGSEPELVRQLRVFGEKRTAADTFVSMVPPADGSDTAEGAELTRESRILIGTFGAERIQMFGVPTANGWVCPQFVYSDGEEGDGGPCFSTLRDGVSFAIDGDDSLYRVYGVAADDVRGVTVVTGTSRFAAEMGRNSFVFETSPAVVCPTEIKQLAVTREDGRTSTIDLADVSSLPAASGAELGCHG
jgi:hypothetical protein